MNAIQPVTSSNGLLTPDTIKAHLATVTEPTEIGENIDRLDAWAAALREIGTNTELLIDAVYSGVEARIRAVEIYDVLEDERGRPEINSLPRGNELTPKGQAREAIGVTGKSLSQWRTVRDNVPAEERIEIYLNHRERLDEKFGISVYLDLAQQRQKEQRKQKARQQRQQELEEIETVKELPLSLYVGRAENLPLEDATVDLIVTSPPYNLGDDNWPMGGGGRTTRDGIEYSAHGDDMNQLEYETWQIEVLCELYRVAKPGASLFYNHKARTVGGRIVHPMHWLASTNNPWTIRQEVIWDRESTHNHSATLFWPIDERIYWMTKGAPTVRTLSIGQPTIWSEFGPIPNTWHPAPFTDKLPRMLLEAIGVDSQTVVLDPFAGSCTTLRVALELGCAAIGVDISREYLEQACLENGWDRGILN